MTIPKIPIELDIFALYTFSVIYMDLNFFWIWGKNHYPIQILNLHNMKLISWNVNWIRAVFTKGFMDYLHVESPDVICLQEVKALEEEFPWQMEVMMSWYKIYWNSAEKRWYSGTAILSKKEPLRVTYWLWYAEHDNEWRIITLEFEDFYLINVYTPNSKRDLERLDYRQLWDSLFLDYMKRLEQDKWVIVCGDLNVAHKEIDLTNPKQNRRNAWFTDEERWWFQKFVDAWFIDSFRYYYPDLEWAYSWWWYFANMRERNIGWRIDYFLVSQNLKDKMQSAFIRNDVLWSDHCPVWLIIQ